MSNPLVEYTARLVARRAAHERWVRLDGRLSNSRLGIAAVAALLAWLAYWRGLSPWWIAAPVVAFLALARWHERVIRARDLSARSAEFYSRGIARIEERWAGGGEPGSRYQDDSHLYARDLDLFGPGSLFELLSTARTRAGEDTLAGWLKAPSPLPDLRNRQRSVEELRDRLDFREAMALAGAPVRSVDTESLTAWAASPPILRSGWPRIVSFALTGAAVASGIAGEPIAFVVTILVQFGFAWAFRSRVERVLHGVEGPSRALDVLAQALVEIETQPVASERLTVLKSTLAGRGPSASAAIGRLHRLVELHDWQHNQFFAPIAFVLMWSMHVAWALERWRREIGASVPAWIRTLGEYEAVISLASYAYEHPSDPFPTFIDNGPAAFHGMGLRHPLVPPGRMVPNDVRLDDNVRLLIISGSNMSGKSTLLRTVGTNVVLALAGAPVRASSLELTFLRLGATLRIEDSLRAGRSRFYAEIARIREIADLAREPGSLTFLFDELFQGTNSNDRAAAAAVVLRTLVERHAIGLVTTHDLALTRLVDDLGGRAVNAHFEDRFEGGEMEFDYLLKPGPATRGNAMALLRMVGLDP
jgi:MutS domain V